MDRLTRRDGRSVLKPYIGPLVGLLSCVALAGASAPSIPATPAGDALAGWLDAFNSGDASRMESFKAAHAQWLNLERMKESRARTGGYDLLTIDGSGKLWVTFQAKEKATQIQISGSLVVKPDNPVLISELTLSPSSAPSEAARMTVKKQKHLIEGVRRVLSQFYVFPDTATIMSAMLRKNQKRGEYDAVTDSEVFATRLTDDLRAASHDKHVLVSFSTEVVPPDPVGGPAEDPARGRREVENNCGFEKAEHYPPNIGYLKLSEFAVPEFCAETAAAAMRFIADSDALILDLRENHGGAPRMAALISSYLFDRPTHLEDIHDREKDTTEQLWTVTNLPGKTFTEKPVFVLTSSKTFSAAEQISYDLKALKRATLIGERTGGGAHPVSPHRLDDHFWVGVPFARFINPITHTDWEGTGVKPDVEVRAADALDEALKRAREKRPDSPDSRQ
jgi:Peptidase family S41/N-terminal domain of Peptidase_S41 in eukaryotic IRBP